MASNVRYLTNAPGYALMGNMRTNTISRTQLDGTPYQIDDWTVRAYPHPSKGTFARVIAKHSNGIWALHVDVALDVLATWRPVW